MNVSFINLKKIFLHLGIQRQSFYQPLTIILPLELPTFSLQIEEMEGGPEEWSLNSPDGNTGLFMGLSSEAFKGSTFSPLNIILMRPDELLYAIEKEKAGRMELAALYVQQGESTISNLEKA